MNHNSPYPAREEGSKAKPLVERQTCAKLHFTLGLICHMIVPLVVSSPICCCRMEGLTSLDIGPLDPEPVSLHNAADHAIAVVGGLATFQNSEATAC